MNNWQERKAQLIRDVIDDAKFQYAHVWDVPPHDPGLDELSEAELAIYTEARFEYAAILAGIKKPGVSTSFEEMAKRRMEEAKDELEVVDPEELWGDDESARNSSDHISGLARDPANP